MGWSHNIICDPSQTGYWDAQSKYSDTVMGVNTGGNGHVQASVCSLVFNRQTPTSIVDDVMVTSFAFAGPVISNATSILLTADKATIETALTTWWTSVKAFVPLTITLKELRWHDYLDVMGKPGPAVRVTPVNVAATGVSSNTVPDQVAETVTFRTASRLHWGRVYLPKLIYTSFDPYGRIVHATCDSIATATRTLYNSAVSAGCEFYVVSREHGALLTVSQLAMDNTPDVIRRRRVKQPEYIKVFTS